MAKKFKRKIAITVAQMKPEQFFLGAAAAGLTNAVVVRDLDIKCKIEKSLTENPNTAEIEIYNANESSRAAFKVKPALLRVEAGYQPDPTKPADLALIFEGDITFAESEHDEVDWLTKINAGEGSRAYANARMNKAYAAGSTYSTMIGDTAKSMGLKIPTSIKDAKDLAGNLVSGRALQGPSRTQMTKLTGAAGVSWSVQNGQLQLLSKLGVRPDEAIVISSATGMIGQPVAVAPKQPGDPAGVRVKTLLEPALIPGGRIKIISESLNGLYKIDKVTITISNFEQEFYCDVEGLML